MVDLIANPRIFLNIRKVQSEEAIRMHCNSEVKIVDRVGDLPGYGTIWYEPTEITNILSMSRATKKFRVIFDTEGRNFQDGPAGQGGEISTHPQRAVLFRRSGQVEQCAAIKHGVGELGRLYTEGV